MRDYVWTSIVTLGFGIVLFGMSLTVSRLRVTKGIPAPATTGDPLLERAFRAHMNTAEWAPIFLPALWLFAINVGDAWAALLGAAWLMGRIVYFVGYLSDPEKRFVGMSIQAAAALALSFGALGRILYSVF